ncbi:MAG: hypothetical protein GY774_13590, partial [Planctomycetes bacterium]|nr:hypothetical protein [Planctomycetota bacterium]
MARQIHSLGHSFAQRLEMATGSADPAVAVPANLGCKIEKEEVSFVTGLHDEQGNRLPHIRFNTIDHVIQHFPAIKAEYGNCDVCVVVLGTNDIACRPADVKLLVRDMIKLATQMRSEWARSLAFVEVLTRRGGNAFPEYHCPDFQPDDLQSQEDIDRIFKEKVGVWNMELQDAISGHPDMHWISLRGLRGEDRFAQDGIHFTGEAQKQFAKY